MFLEVKHISKQIGMDEVLKDITISMEKGKVYGFQGKNGCGKSMLMRVICGLVIPTHGSVTIDGEQLGKELSFPRSLGMMIEKPGFLGTYTGLQNLEMLAAIRSKMKKKEIEDVLARVGLEDVMHKKYRKYSLGMKQKLGIAAAIMEKPDILILDEPTNHLDVDAKDELKRALLDYRGSVLLICHEPEFYKDVVNEVWDMSKWTTKIL